METSASRVHHLAGADNLISDCKINDDKSYQVGMGMKPSLANLATSKEVKDVLMACWFYNADQRPGFSDIGHILDRL